MFSIGYFPVSLSGEAFTLSVHNCCAGNNHFIQSMNKYIIFTASAIILPLFAGAQQVERDTAMEEVSLNETVVAASRGSQARTAVAQQVRVIRRTEIERVNAPSTADLLSNTGQVFVQKSQQGGGSPVIRGFEASRVLLVVDGVRMNNAIYRAGHLQNVITMDNAALDRAEVLFGPASTVYGTDALGGAICFFTKNPELAGAGEKLKAGAQAFVRYGTVNQEKTGHLDFNLGRKKFGSFTSFTYSDFSDLRMGTNEGTAPLFGLREYYADRINGRDTLVKNPDPYVQKYSGYSQYDLLQKMVFQPSARVRHTLNVQYSNSSNIPRYDRLTDPKGAGLNSAEWYYGPQKRLMTAYNLNIRNIAGFDEMDVTASWQDIEESRYSRNFGAARRTERVENVNVYGFLAQGVKYLDNQTLRMGIDGQYNNVQSNARRVDVNTGDITTQSTRYPDGGSSMYNIAAFATHSWQHGDTWTFSEGLRTGFSSLNCTFVSTEYFSFLAGEVSQQSPLIAGNFGAVYHGWRNWRVAANASSGFRVPNVDDMGKVFDSQPGSVVIPNPDLKPEKSYNIDLNVLRNVADKLHWENVLWATALRDAVVADKFQANGRDSIDYDGVNSRVLALQNKRSASLWGFSSTLQADLAASWSVYASVAYTRGRIADDSPLDHIPPMYGKVGGRWHTPKVYAEAYLLFNGKKKLEDYNLEGEDNLQYAPADGMPAWYTLNVRGGYNIGRNLILQAGIDNILDVQYRTFASGINGPGRNIWLTLRVKV
jgi:hemoglobin/transferrin/lactoferrin receptor protein